MTDTELAEALEAVATEHILVFRGDNDAETLRQAATRLRELSGAAGGLAAAVERELRERTTYSRGALVDALAAYRTTPAAGGRVNGRD